jgi:hypothetical protein
MVRQTGGPARKELVFLGVHPSIFVHQRVRGVATNAAEVLEERLLKGVSPKLVRRMRATMQQERTTPALEAISDHQ